MQRNAICWKKVQIEGSSQEHPSPRWGHACCVIDDEMVFFGGYADSNYMNDLWSFNSSTSKWTKVITTGDLPENRSNCTINYDPKRSRVIVFGGGGPNKKRFNTLHVLDWNTKVWSELKPAETSKVPIERTYHTAEFVKGYLVVFGGEGHWDIDDLWVFDFELEQWTEVICDDQSKPTARRFHSSAVVGSEMFIIGGCHGRYRSLNSIYSLDLSGLIENQNYSSLKWKEIKTDGASFLTRWGHSSTVYDGKIYVFAGRFSNDLNDLLVIDPQNLTIRLVMKNIKESPIPRRRHCAAFIGSSLVIFGGFNGEYFNDLHYVNVEDPSRVWWINKSKRVLNISKLCINNPTFSDSTITLKNGEKMSFNLQLLSRGFRDCDIIPEFIEYIQSECDVEDAVESIRYLSLGQGPIKPSIHSKFNLRGEASLRKTITPKEHYLHINRVIRGNDSLEFTFPSGAELSGIIQLNQKYGSEWETALSTLQRGMNLDVEFSVGEELIKCSKLMLSFNSKYFQNFFEYSNLSQVKIRENPKIFKLLLLFILSDHLIIDSPLSTPELIDLVKISKLYHLDRLTSICQYYFLSHCSGSISSFLSIAVEHKLSNLQNYCAQVQLRKQILLRNQQITNPFTPIQNQLPLQPYTHKLRRLNSQIVQVKNKVLKKCYFDIIQTKVNSKLESKQLLKKGQTSKQFQKENLEAN